MQPQDFLAPGASAGAVAMVFMFKMYIDRRKNGIENSEVRSLRRELQDKERREELKPLADAINGLSIVVQSSHTAQMEVLKVIAQGVQK